MTGFKESVVSYVEGIVQSEILSMIIVNAIVIVLWLIVGVILVKLLKKFIRKLLNLKNDNKRTVTVAKLLSNIVGYFVWFIIVLIILNEMNVNIAPLIASAGILGLAIGFGAQEIVKDFISGFFIIIDNIVNVGETIEVQGFKGDVLEIGLRTTRIKNYKGEIKIVNNGDLKNIINFSRDKSTALINFSVAYDTDLKNISAIMEEFVKAVKEKYEKLTDTPQFLGVTELADSGINMLVLAKTENGAHYQLERDIRKELVIFLEEKGIEIPFPHVVVKNG